MRDNLIKTFRLIGTNDSVLLPSRFAEWRAVRSPLVRQNPFVATDFMSGGISRGKLGRLHGQVGVGDDHGGRLGGRGDEEVSLTGGVLPSSCESIVARALRLAETENPVWEQVRTHLMPLPIVDGVYVHSHEWAGTYVRRNCEPQPPRQTGPAQGRSSGCR